MICFLSFCPGVSLPLGVCIVVDFLLYFHKPGPGRAPFEGLMTVVGAGVLFCR